jgi:hypothetical protein
MRPGAGCKSARGRRTRPVLAACRPQPVRLGEVRDTCNSIGDEIQHHSDTKFRHPEVRAGQAIVIAGLDPAIHAASQSALRLSMDHRVEPGGDESVQPRLKNYTARSCFCAVVRLAKVPHYAVDGVRGLRQDP